VTGAGRRAVAVGGGTGLPVVLRCLLEQGFETSAVVTMADDGGSTGVLRRDFGMSPPGDVRNCIVAMSDPDSALPALFQYRFSDGEGLAGHSLGNLVLAALADMEGDFVRAIRSAERLLGSRGHVHPVTLEDVHLTALDAEGTPIRGQARIARTGRIARVGLEPDSPPGYPAALEALRDADAIVIGPGSLFTSLIPNFLVEGVVDAVRSSAATKVYVCNVANQRGETAGMDAADHVAALVDHGMREALDIVLVNQGPGEPRAEASSRASAEESLTERRPAPSERVCDDEGEQPEPVAVDDSVRARIEGFGLRVVAADIVDPSCLTRHDPLRLCRALSEVL